MKNIILILSIFTCSLLNAQQFTRAETAQTEKQETAIQLTVDNFTFEGYLTSKGQTYILRTSKNTGKTYKQYLGYKYPAKFEGKQVYTNKDETEFWILGLTKTKQPKKIKLNRN